MYQGMYKKVLLFLFLGVCAIEIHAQETNETGDLVLEISEFRNTKGHLLISIFNTEKDFPDNNQAAFRNKKVQASAAVEPIIFEDLPYGEYAVIFLHDENDNKKMDTNMVGMPLEGYGASNNAVNTFSAPKYKEASIKLSQAVTKQKLNIYY